MNDSTTGKPNETPESGKPKRIPKTTDSKKFVLKV